MRNWFYEQMAMYSAYHRDYRNQLTHHLGVPMIVFSIMVLLSPIELMQFESGPLNLATVLMAGLLLFYILSAPLVGTIATFIYGGLLYFANIVGQTNMEIVLKIFGVFFVGGWAIQFTGHIYEGRKPALFDNILQIFMAPSFLIAEVLFLLKLEKGLKAEIEERMPAYLPEAKEE
ncbi:DUF962 domain-containing protein [Kordiimonas sp. SCSIO 12603]|uniref:Mpo1 family 2-hydroxy fatty acid dioxygenase n=1 Tax=Kordiimonas sp. SCSIO 12603 TaxID=2829596 RepID=UPI0021083F61|nr:Mpo1-like protein [Kordiimonas sp. SCSIO 12603]UTW59234.1 DUF962 domain-containing protein [Kordiimonas sp. SCSIO 12603]